jgi:hypothetical protein
MVRRKRMQFESYTRVHLLSDREQAVALEAKRTARARPSRVKGMVRRRLTATQGKVRQWNFCKDQYVHNYSALTSDSSDFVFLWYSDFTFRLCFFFAVEKGEDQRGWNFCKTHLVPGCSKVGLLHETNNLLICGFYKNDALCFPYMDLIRFSSLGSL